MNYKIFFSGLLLGLAAFIIYLFYYDTLIPGLIEGSYRLTNFTGFAISCFLLADGQIIIGGFLLNVMATAVDKKKGDYLRGLFIVSLMTFLFSFTYVIFPQYGPFFYIVYSVGMAPWYSIPFEILWTSFVVIFGAIMIHREYKMNMNYATLFSIIIYLGITAAAS
jgi:hypothetical protein